MMNTAILTHVWQSYDYSEGETPPTFLFIWNVLSRVYVSRLSLAPNPHEEWLELGLVQLLKSCVGVALVCCQHRHYVFAAEVALATQLVVLAMKVSNKRF